MIAFEVNDVTCGHCASTITKAIQTVDKDAKISNHEVRIEPGSGETPAFRDAIKGAGYTPEPLDAARPSAAPQRRGGCCG
ncbi:heavy-metal-associated domain-containing protein [Piscinibacter koreensis]|uniref:Heavy-metal-associated domain-containing protein n=1 Tax=Piscinibacter koreensis TaxID=2742824 RepID=A0A7Y6NSG5_9BURK|nr:heavy-metal-associated domain-containing protein [Schlegelella koreensis]NUZ08498.1 heavy-metal-associated domain-containing protein [Schlegelella koreensis]